MTTNRNEAQNEAAALVDEGDRLSARGESADALACYDRALELDANFARAWYNKGDELARHNRFIEAKACFENAAALGIPQASALAAKCDEILMNEFYG